MDQQWFKVDVLLRIVMELQQNTKTMYMFVAVDIQKTNPIATAHIRKADLQDKKIVLTVVDCRSSLFEWI